MIAAWPLFNQLAIVENGYLIQEKLCLVLKKTIRVRPLNQAIKSLNL